MPETQGFVTSTAISTFGTVTERDSIVSQIANTGKVPPVLPINHFDYAVYTSSYSENTIADQGLITYTKGISADTAGMAAENQYNVVTNKLVEFIGSDTGRMISDESTLLDGAGTSFYDEQILLCPFASGTYTINPPFCNIVEEGSSVDITLGSLTTGTEERHIMLLAGESVLEGLDADLPVSTPGVELNYDIKLTGFGDVPATGSVLAYMNVHIQEARDRLYGGLEQKAEDLVYTESTTAAGDITLFQKMMKYNSKITAPGPVDQPG